MLDEVHINHSAYKGKSGDKGERGKGEGKKTQAEKEVEKKWVAMKKHS